MDTIKLEEFVMDCLLEFLEKNLTKLVCSYYYNVYDWVCENYKDKIYYQDYVDISNTWHHMSINNLDMAVVYTAENTINKQYYISKTCDLTFVESIRVKHDDIKKLEKFDSIMPSRECVINNLLAFLIKDIANLVYGYYNVYDISQYTGNEHVLHCNNFDFLIPNNEVIPLICLPYSALTMHIINKNLEKLLPDIEYEITFGKIYLEAKKRRDIINTKFNLFKGSWKVEAGSLLPNVMSENRIVDEMVVSRSDGIQYSILRKNIFGR